MSTSSKFIIGLGTMLPSIRVLKPPGGDSNDLFGLHSRQKAILQALEKTTGTMSHLQVRDFIDKSKDGSTFKKESGYLKTKKISSDIKIPGCLNLEQKLENGDCKLKSCKGRENVSSLHTSVEDETDESKPKKKSTALRQNQNVGHQKFGRISVLEKEAKGVSNVQLSLRTRSQNPITGSITEVNKDKHFNIKKVIDVNDVSNHRNREKRPAGVRAQTSTMDVGLGSSKRHCHTYTRRNPITGEGTDSNGYKFVPRGIRVIQPPGGISCGLY